MRGAASLGFHRLRLALHILPGTLRRLQDKSRHLRAAVEAQRLLAGKAPADVQQGRRFVEGAAVVAAAVEARYEQRAEQGEANLPAVVVPGQHQVDAVLPSPADVVRRVAQAQAEKVRGA